MDHNPRTVVASVPVPGRRFVNRAGGLGGADVIGVSENDAVAGKPCSVITLGNAVVEAAVSMPAGSVVDTDAQGRAVLASGLGLGVTERAAVAGGRVDVRLHGLPGVALQRVVSAGVNPLTGNMDLTAGGEPVSVGSAPPVAPSVAQRTIAFLGDSLTIVVPPYLLSNLEYSTHVLRRCPWLQLVGKFGTGGMGLTVAGTGGLTYAQAVASLRAVSPQPTDVMLLIGTNDIATNTAAQLIVALRAAVDELIGYGYAVIMSELTPRNDIDAATKTKMHTVNTWINRHARLNNLRCNHFYSACVDTGGAGTWRSGYNADDVHPSAVGADAMGAVAAATLTAYQWRPYLVADTADAASTGTSLQGGLMLADVRTNGGTFENAGDGIPDFFGKASAPAAGIVSSLESGAGAIIGNWYQQVRTNQAGAPVLRSFRRAASPGDVIAFGCVFDTDSAADGGTMSINACTATTTSWHDGVVTTRRSVAFGGAGYDSDVRECYIEFVVPSGAVSTCVDITTTASTSGGTFRVGQVTMRNLTALGIA